MQSNQITFTIEIFIIVYENEPRRDCSVTEFLSDNKQSLYVHTLIVCTYIFLDTCFHMCMTPINFGSDVL